MARNSEKLKSAHYLLAATVFVWVILAIISAVFRNAALALFFTWVGTASLIVSLALERRIFGKRNGA